MRATRFCFSVCRGCTGALLFFRFRVNAVHVCARAKLTSCCVCFCSLRQLRWAWGQGTAELSVQFSEKVTKTVVATTLQAVVLLWFNSRPSFTVEYVL